ncbi:hypothetical protein L484_019345 [Morus notabilis]|uniref:Uncharacterized protein n=1 Tax=Morus notabilis TaxID=981085 RepID=W9QWR3_9ROSA|nr:hypothetical protein L484_019345 [Morus notabilis]
MWGRFAMRGFQMQSCDGDMYMGGSLNVWCVDQDNSSIVLGICCESAHSVVASEAAVALSAMEMALGKGWENLRIEGYMKPVVNSLSSRIAHD